MISNTANYETAAATYTYPDGVETTGNDCITTLQRDECGCKRQVKHWWGEMVGYPLSWCVEHIEAERARLAQERLLGEQG